MKWFQAVGGKPLLTKVLERRYFNRVKSTHVNQNENNTSISSIH